MRRQLEQLTQGKLGHLQLAIRVELRRAQRLHVGVHAPDFVLRRAPLCHCLPSHGERAFGQRQRRIGHLAQAAAQLDVGVAGNDVGLERRTHLRLGVGARLGTGLRGRHARRGHAAVVRTHGRRDGRRAGIGSREDLREWIELIDGRGRKPRAAGDLDELVLHQPLRTERRRHDWQEAIALLAQRFTTGGACHFAHRACSREPRFAL